MRILFLAPDYFGLHMPIIDEMEHQGHEVIWVEDIDIPYNFRLPRTGFNKLLCKVNAVLKRPHKRFWKRIIKERKNDFNKPFDLFFCINGRTLCPELFDYLNKMQGIRKVMYVWDTQKVFDFYYYKSEFDRIFTFDFDDSQIVPGAEYLPFYWFNDDKNNVDTTIKYDVSIIGTDHDGRFNFVEKLLPQVKANNLRYFFKIKVFEPDLSYIFMYKLRMKLSKVLRQVVADNYKDYQKRIQSEIAMTSSISPADYMHIINQSACIIDTDRASQSGTTPRVIWALATGKKIISTNINLLKAPFYTPLQISIIDRTNPVLDISFIFSRDHFDIHPYIIDLRIDNWINRLLSTIM